MSATSDYEIWRGIMVPATNAWIKLLRTNTPTGFVPIMPFTMIIDGIHIMVTTELLHPGEIRVSVLFSRFSGPAIHGFFYVQNKPKLFKLTPEWSKIEVPEKLKEIQPRPEPDDEYEVGGPMMF